MFCPHLETGYFSRPFVYLFLQLTARRRAESVKVFYSSNSSMTISYVTKRHGDIQPFDLGKIERSLRYLTADHSQQINIQELLNDVLVNLYDKMPTEEITDAIIMALRGRMDQYPAYSNIAARYMFNNLYKGILKTGDQDETFEEKYRTTFAVQLKKGIEAGRLDPRLGHFDIAKISAAIQPQRDRLFKYLGAQTLYDRYFLKDHSQKILELPQYFWMRVAMGLALEELQKEDRAIEFYHAMSQLYYVPSTPTLFHSGTSHPQMSSCFLTTVEDDLVDIFKNYADNAQLSKWSGGVANDWTNIRATGALIKSTNVFSQGVIPFLKIVDSTTAAINRSGKRRGATCVYLEAWHYDIEDFLELRKNTGDERRRTHDVNTSNWIPDLFMKRMINDGDWTLFSPDETPELHHIYGKEFEIRYEQYEKMAAQGEIRLFKKVKAKELWRKMLTMLFSTGHAWITFKDPCNVRSPQDHVGVVHSSNLCTEITLNTSKDETAVCNLGSINLLRHTTENGFDRPQLEKTVAVAMRMLDNVIDLNFYPTKESKVSNLRHRPVGLGVMGLQEALYKLKLPFDSEEAVRFSDENMEFISYHAILNSSKLAQEKGAYATYKGSKWDRNLFPIDTLKMHEHERGVEIPVNKEETMDWQIVRNSVRKYGMRNSNCMAIAPTATISNIAGCTPSIEPIYKHIYVKANHGGDFIVINDFLADALKARGLWTPSIIEKMKIQDGTIVNIDEIPADMKQIYKTVFEIHPEWVVKHAAVRGKWIDQSQSINIFADNTSGKFFSDVYTYAWKMGLKTTYYLRTIGASQVDRATITETNSVAVNTPEQAPAPEQQAPTQTITMQVLETVTITSEPTPEPVQQVVPQPIPVTVPASEPTPAPTPTPAPQPIMQVVPPLQTAPTVPIYPNVVTPVQQPAPEIKLCRLDDPTCESCQ